MLRNLLKAEVERCMNVLPTLDVSSEAYGMALHNLGTLDFMLKSEPGPEQKDTPTPVKVEEPVPEPYVEESTPYEEPAKVFTLADVRAKLNAKIKEGVDVPAIIREMGFKGLTAIPAERYGELLAKAGVSNA